MTKVKMAWFCSSCGSKQAKWTGQCSACGGWNTFQEEILYEPSSSFKPSIGMKPGTQTVGFHSLLKPVTLQEIQGRALPRHKSGFKELDKTLGGGIVPGSLILLGGDPGIGKSTISLQVAHKLSDTYKKRVLYVSGEESLEQIALRAKRLGVADAQDILFCNTTEVGAISTQIDELHPTLVIIDSIQILFCEAVPSSPGSVAQVRECTSRLMQTAKTLNVAIILIGHVTKAGEIAGPKVLEHLVDTVLYFEGDKTQNLRLVRAIKNRFGPLDEIAVFQMNASGLCEVENPSQLFIEDRAKGTSGSVIIPMMEGTRPILIEAQALVTETFFPNPSRRSTGLDPNRLALLLAVCEKRAKMKLYQSDVFVSITGGFKVTETAADLGIVLAIVSSLSNVHFDVDTIVIGEVGLGGEVRGVSRIESRIKEGIQMGFSKCILPNKNMKTVASSMKNKVDLIGVEWVEDAIAHFSR